jgi:hypothetical protein
LITLALKGTEKKSKIPAVLYDIASENLQRNSLRRWWCAKYSRPPTDPLLAAYTEHELVVEYLEDLIDEGKVITGADGKPAEVIEHKGESIYKVGFEEWDEAERRWAEQRPIEELVAELNESNSDNVLDSIKKEATENA